MPISVLRDGLSAVLSQRLLPWGFALFPNIEHYFPNYVLISERANHTLSTTDFISLLFADVSLHSLCGGARG
jgi:hypothetical protein